MQGVKTLCCHWEELTHWLCNVTDVTHHLASPKSHLTALKSSLQLCWQFKKAIDEHQESYRHTLDGVCLTERQDSSSGL